MVSLPHPAWGMAFWHPRRKEMLDGPRLKMAKVNAVVQPQERGCPTTDRRQGVQPSGSVFPGTGTSRPQCRGAATPLRRGPRRPRLRSHDGDLCQVWALQISWGAGLCPPKNAPRVSKAASSRRTRRGAGTRGHRILRILAGLAPMQRTRPARMRRAGAECLAQGCAPLTL